MKIVRCKKCLTGKKGSQTFLVRKLRDGTIKFYCALCKTRVNLEVEK